jgi:hypothetical protein
MISEKERRWVERMQDAGLFPKPSATPSPPFPPEGTWSMTGYGDGTVLVQINKPLSLDAAMEIVKLTGAEHITVDAETLRALRVVK